MTADPLVSVVVPTYCHAGYLADCLQSIHDQTYDALELVLIDDCSTDETWERAQDLLSGPLAQRFRNTILLRNEHNLGAHATINRAIAAAQGNHLSLINSDDRYHPDRIATLMAALADTGSEIGFSLVEVLAEADPAAEIDEFFRLFALRQLFAFDRDPTTGFALMRANVAISTGNLLFTRNLYQQAGPFQPLKYCHDWDFLLQALFFTEPVVVQEPHYFYRLHDTNSFSSLGHVTSIELEETTRRFLRRGLQGKPSPNPLFPCEANWPGYFEHVLRECGYEGHMRREKDGGAAGFPFAPKLINPTG
ncbi:glycosyltransferase [Paracoccus onubensis]|uniref:glycosyltransferase family 2 protein n=1 Tax=Paracoccus onubensis TaxID=1675788 RepID=UPI002731AC07|nr:glycosyltransferase family 2 protein [Paracoccus onubensis]MDP0928015.1 glycosyltransferase [Paracoccus onubensis]